MRPEHVNSLSLSALYEGGSTKRVSLWRRYIYVRIPISYMWFGNRTIRVTNLSMFFRNDFLKLDYGEQYKLLKRGFGQVDRKLEKRCKRNCKIITITHGRLTLTRCRRRGVAPASLVRAASIWKRKKERTRIKRNIVNFVCVFVIRASRDSDFSRALTSVGEIYGLSIARSKCTSWSGRGPIAITAFWGHVSRPGGQGEAGGGGAHISYAITGLIGSRNRARRSRKAYIWSDGRENATAIPPRRGALSRA